jgi:enoyl-CoA hydratase
MTEHAELRTTADITQRSIERSVLPYETLLVQKEEAALLVTINRPQVLNALSHVVLTELSRAIDEAAVDDSVRAVIITGMGDRSFVAGADIAELLALESGLDGHAHSHTAHGLLNKMVDLPKPIIMAVNGYALGGGCELAMAGDLILASEKARFGQPEINLGIIPGFGGTFRLPRLVGRIKAMEMVLLGDMIDAAEAKRIGLVNDVVPPDQLMPKAKEIAAKIAAKSPATVALAKRAVNEGLEIDARAAGELEAVYFGMAVGTEDRREGTSAFLEKRQANFHGR